MEFVKVLVSSNSYHGNEALTYSHDSPLKPGTVVLVPLRRAKVSAIVLEATSKPAFATKPIISVQTTHPLPAGTLSLAKWLGEYYPAPSGAIISQFLPSNLLVKENTPPQAPSPSAEPSITLPALTKQQISTLHSIQESSSRTTLIHGDTGTGKTRLYIELAKESLKKKKSVVILTPEIGLTSQLAHNLTATLSAPVLIFHSNLTGQQRRNLWLRILYSNQPLVIVGPRSALFVPLKSIGLIVVDEAHDNAYKQEQAPRYHALRVAGKLAELHDAKLIFGTATPLINEYYFLSTRKVPILRLTELATGESFPPKVQVVDGRDRSLYARHPYLSDALLGEITEALERGEQSLVFLNRRGTARIVMCQNGDWQALCPRCAIPLTYHGDSHLMRCHTCGYSSKPLSSCPECGSPDIIFKSIGTKAIADALTRLFPEARVQRFDTDNTKEERLEQHYQAIHAGDVDILVGTQLLVKGLDLPRLTTVGVVAADSSLYFPDYTAEEQTYQLLTQVVGRVGRGHGRSSIVIQSYNPSGRALSSVLQKDWQSFYESQINERQLHDFPPFYYILKLTAGRKSQSSASSAAAKLKDQLLQSGLPIEVIGPAPRFHEVSGGDYHWQLIVKAKQRSALISVINQLPANWTYDIDPLNLL